MELINLSEATRTLGLGKRAKRATLAKIGIEPVYDDGAHGPTLYDKGVIMAAKKKMDAERRPMTLEDRVSALEKLVAALMSKK